MSEIDLNKISFVAMIVALFAKRHRYSEPVAYQYISKYGGDKLLVDHYGYLHTQDFDQVVKDLGDYIIRLVSQQSLRVNSKSQTPCVTPSATLGSEWQTWKLK